MKRGGAREGLGEEKRNETGREWRIEGEGRGGDGWEPELTGTGWTTPETGVGLGQTGAGADRHWLDYGGKSDTEPDC